MNALNMTCVTILPAAMNLTVADAARGPPRCTWEPTMFVPLIPSMVIACAGVLLLAWYLGLKERRRLGVVTAQGRLDGQQRPMTATRCRLWKTPRTSSVRSCCG